MFELNPTKLFNYKKEILFIVLFILKFQNDLLNFFFNELIVKLKNVQNIILKQIFTKRQAILCVFFILKLNISKEKLIFFMIFSLRNFFKRDNHATRIHNQKQSKFFIFVSILLK